MSIAKRVDVKGRLVLGVKYANTTVLLEPQKNGSLLIKKAAIVPVKNRGEVVKFVARTKHAANVDKSILPSITSSAVENIKRMRGFLKGMNTTVHREKDRL
jgi:hypothetical protein